MVLSSGSCKHVHLRYSASFLMTMNSGFSAFSQNHRMAEAGGDLLRSCGPAPLLKQDHLEPVAQDHVQTAFDYL